MLCAVDWYNTPLYGTLAPNFFSCIDLCAQWNLNNNITCVGVTFVERAYPPWGNPAMGSGCTFAWTMNGPPHSSLGTQAALLEIPINGPIISSIRAQSDQPTIAATSTPASPKASICSRLIVSLNQLTSVTVLLWVVGVLF